MKLHLNGDVLFEGFAQFGPPLLVEQKSFEGGLVLEHHLTVHDEHLLQPAHGAHVPHGADVSAVLLARFDVQAENFEEIVKYGEEELLLLFLRFDDLLVELHRFAFHAFLLLLVRSVNMCN